MLFCAVVMGLCMQPEYKYKYWHDVQLAMLADAGTSIKVTRAYT